MCTFFTIDKYYYVFLKCVNKDIINRGIGGHKVRARMLSMTLRALCIALGAHMGSEWGTMYCIGGSYGE